MHKIHQLPPEIIAKIAAGEVIERPAYAVKELIDNSLDAGAKNITITIEKSGLKKIEVSDDGEGMSLEDIQECFKPHTTSKIKRELDLYSIKSFGFRGEALSSIAAISDLTIISKTAKQTAGTLLELHNGAVKKLSPIGAPVGTTVTALHLLSTTPARKKFLKSFHTEFRYILDVSINFALAYPNVHFTLVHNNRTIFDLPITENIFDRITLLLSRTVSENLIPIEFEDSYLQISGFIGKPQIAQRNAKNYLFVNNRPVSDKTITTTIKEIFGSLLETHSYPFYILFLKLPYEAVDVNVHPRKEQVSFLDSTMINQPLAVAVEETLSTNNLLFSNIRTKKEQTTNSVAGQILKESVIPWQTRDLFSLRPEGEIIQIHNLYLVTQSENGVIFIDQHAAHERILFEKLLTEFSKQKQQAAIFRLPKTISFDLSFSDAEILKEYLYIFTDIGFEIENFKDNTFIVTAVPELFKDRRHEKLIMEMLEDVKEKKDLKTIDTQSKRMIAFLACRTAVKRGDSLTKEQAKELIKQLELSPNNITCPHGRPTKVEVPLSYIHKNFKR